MSLNGEHQPGIGLDYDGTIADTGLAKADWIREHLGIEVPPWRTDRTMCVPIIGAENYERLSRVVYAPEASMRADEVPGASLAIRALSKEYRLFIVTARDAQQMTWAREWLANRGLDACMAGFLSSAQRAADGSRLSKAQLCRDNRIDVLIDDDERHLRDSSLAGLRRILLKNGCDQPLDLADGIELASSWDQVSRLLGREGAI